MRKLVFEDIEAVKELYEHTKKCAHHRKTYGELTGPGLWLVHDQGVYLMSNGIPHLEDPDKPEGSRIVQAKGCDPKKDDEWWDESRQLVGGDDFVEHLPITSWDRIFKLYEECGNGRIEIEVMKTSIAVSFVEVREAKKKLVKAVMAMSDDIDID